MDQGNNGTAGGYTHKILRNALSMVIRGLKINMLRQESVAQ
jgi:hypothetical protein